MDGSGGGRLPAQVGTLDSPMAGSPELPATSGGARLALLTSVWKLARQKYYWSPARFPRILWTMACNIQTQARVLRVLSRPAYRRLMAVNPRFPLKYSGLDYLARGLTVAEQAECFIHHYRRLSELFPENVLTQVLLEVVPLDKISEGDDCFTVTMGLSRPWDDEGELSLHFEVNGKVVFVLSFTIIPGWVVQSEAQEVVLISRLQGVKGAFDEIQRATKALCDVAPARVLFAALVGFAEAFGITAMAGINAAMKPEFHFYEGEAANIQEAYDGFFAELGATRCPAGFFLAPLPTSEKPLATIKRGHKIRTKRRRALRLEISQRICLHIREICGSQLDHNGRDERADGVEDANQIGGE